MAAFQDVVIPDLSLLVGQKWSKWQNALNLQGIVYTLFFLHY